MPRIWAFLPLIAVAVACGGSSATDEPALEPLATRTSAPIAFVRGDDPARELVAVAPNGTGERTVVQLPRDHELNDFSWSPDGRHLAFSASAHLEPYHDAISIVNADGSGLRALTRRRDPAAGPFWSPAGDRILFDRHNDGDHQLWVIDAAGKNARRLTPGSDFSDPSWSPYGTRIAYSDLARRGGWIYVMNADGSEKRRITRSDYYGGGLLHGGRPQWSPAGDAIAFFSGWDLWVIVPDGTARRRVAEIKGLPHYAFRWSPDGKRIAFAAELGDRDWELAVVDVQTRQMRQLTNNGLQEIYPSWSPDGRALAFLRYKPGFGYAEPGQADVYVMNADGTGGRNLTNSAADEDYPLWAPRG